MLDQEEKGGTGVDKLAWVRKEGLVGPGLGVMRSLSDSYSVADLELSPFSEVDAGEHGRGMATQTVDFGGWVWFKIVLRWRDRA